MHGKAFRVEIRSHPMKADRPDVGLLAGVVAPEILHAMREAARLLSAAGIRHALAGALAVGAHGYPRASRDVDFVVGDEAFTVHGGGVVTINPSVPVRVQNVAVDPISAGADEGHLIEAVERAPVSGGIPVLPIEALIYMKLKSPRRKDAGDVVELVKAGVDVGQVTEYLAKHAAHLVRKFKELTSEADAE